MVEWHEHTICAWAADALSSICSERPNKRNSTPPHHNQTTCAKLAAHTMYPNCTSQHHIAPLSALHPMPTYLVTAVDVSVLHRATTE